MAQNAVSAKSNKLGMQDNGISDNYSNNNMSIRNFYKGKNILITGATGFLGKVLLWKLLKSCPDSGTLYVLLRSKSGVPVEKRILKLLTNAPFAPAFSYDDIRDKVVAIESDITCPSLGLSDRDRDTLTSTVNVVFHCAASVKFDAPLKDNIRDNVVGTQGIIELCKQTKQLASFIHVSTAYSNCHLKDISEDFHELKHNPDDVLKVTNFLSSDSCGKITEAIIEGRPNTYTYTKAMAEDLVVREQNTIPVGIVRPSIVTPSAQEPQPGWIDNVNGLVGLTILGALGILRDIDWNYWAISDVVPVDYVANCILAAGQSVGVNKRLLNEARSSTATSKGAKIPVYNMTSGNTNPISWGQFFDLTRDSAYNTPTNKIARPLIRIPRHNRANPVTGALTRIFSELLFAYVVDTLIGLFGYKKLMVRITKKLHHAYDILRPFTISEWNFKCDNVVQLMNSLSADDQCEFNFDMKTISWPSYVNQFWLGTREIMLNEPNTQQSIASARRRMLIVNIVHYSALPLMFILIFLLSYRLMPNSWSFSVVEA